MRAKICESTIQSITKRRMHWVPFVIKVKPITSIIFQSITPIGCDGGSHTITSIAKVNI
jgi:hypothetical protein